MGNRENIAHSMQLASDGDLEAGMAVLMNNFAPDFIVHESPMTPFAGDYQGMEEYLPNYENILRHTVPTELKLVRVLGDDEYVCALYTIPWRATPESEPVRILISEWFRFKGDKIAEVWPFFFEVPTAP